ncbi:MAG: hypothetical protein J7501_02095, partial [Bdellovibrio sp.]|nr:hypothetical protein [Bdellovibrio sp.]
MKKLILFVMVLGLQAQAWAVGNEIANGGDSISAEFIRHGQTIGDLWKQLDLPKDFPVNASQFKDIVRDAIVETRDSVDIDGRVLDAINIPTQKRIVVNRARWAQIDDYKKIVIVFHEYVG